MAKKKTKPAKKARKPRQPKGIPDLDARLKDAKPVSEGEVMAPDKGLESCMDPDRAKFLKAAMETAAKPAALDFSILQGDVAHLMGLDAPTIRTVLLKHLELASLTSMKLVNDTLAVIAAPESGEVAREILIRRLGSWAHFTEAVTRQRLMIHKAGFMPDRSPDEDRRDPADLTEEEWTAKFQPQLTAKKPDVQ